MYKPVRTPSAPSASTNSKQQKYLGIKVHTRHFCCCIPVRWGTFVISFLGSLLGLIVTISLIRQLFCKSVRLGIRNERREEALTSD